MLSVFKALVWCKKRNSRLTDSWDIIKSISSIFFISDTTHTTSISVYLVYENHQHLKLWKTPCMRQFWEKISPIDIFEIPTWYFLVCLKRATYSISTLLSRCFSAIMYFYIRLRYTWGLWPQDEWVHTTKDWILSLAARLGPLNVKDMILTHMQRQIHYPYTIWPFSSTPANA